MASRGARFTLDDDDNDASLVTPIEMDVLNSSDDSLSVDDGPSLCIQEVPIVRSYPTRIPIAVGVNTLWSFVVIAIFVRVFDLHQSAFFSFGPSDELKIAFFGTPIDTWMKWSFLMLTIAIDVAISVYVGDMIGPWVMNTAMSLDKPLDMHRGAAWMLLNVNSFVSSFRGAFLMFIFSFTQFDFILAQVGVAAVVGAFSSGWVISHKKRLLY
jgi:hypothetical protein